MEKISFSNAQFVKTATRAKEYPTMRDLHGDILPEVAVVGRSNVGKSTLLNHLFRNKKLVRTSATPGKTQLLNFFNLNNELGFVDLPGYGFARVPLEVRKKWAPMIEEYLKSRDTLKLILFLFDIRRTPNSEDFSLLEWFSMHGRSVILVITKVDKLSKQAANTQAHHILEAFQPYQPPYVLYSATKNIGRQELINLIQDSVGGHHAAS